jgi:hypothetical protein
MFWFGWKVGKTGGKKQASKNIPEVFFICDSSFNNWSVIASICESDANRLDEQSVRDLGDGRELVAQPSARTE